MNLKEILNSMTIDELTDIKENALKTPIEVNDEIAKEIDALAKNDKLYLCHDDLTTYYKLTFDTGDVLLICPECITNARIIVIKAIVNKAVEMGFESILHSNE